MSVTLNILRPPPSYNFVYFRIKHYAGSVTYSVRDFIRKNCDVVERHVSCLLYSAHHPLMRTLFPEGILLISPSPVLEKLANFIINYYQLYLITKDFLTLLCSTHLSFSRFKIRTKLGK